MDFIKMVEKYYAENRNKPVEEKNVCSICINFERKKGTTEGICNLYKQETNVIVGCPNGKKKKTIKRR